MWALNSAKSEAPLAAFDGTGPLNDKLRVGPSLHISDIQSLASLVKLHLWTAVELLSAVPDCRSSIASTRICEEQI